MVREPRDLTIRARPTGCVAGRIDGRVYLSDLTDAEYAVLALHLPRPCSRGRARLHPLRELLDAVFYVVRTGCQWRALPPCFVPWAALSPSSAPRPADRTGAPAPRARWERARLTAGRGHPPRTASARAHSDQ